MENEKRNDMKSSSWELIQDLNKVQNRFMFCPTNNDLWIHKKMMQNQI